VKTLYLLRHAKSDWNNAFDGDHDRPLAPRGIEAAERVGRVLAAAGEIPDRILTSSAVRARTTVELAAESGDWASPQVVVPEF
jgi:phosphohistidine phosphatase